MAVGMPGPAAAGTALTPIRWAPMPRVKCCDSSWSSGSSLPAPSESEETAELMFQTRDVRYCTQQTSRQTMSMSASGGKADLPDPLSNAANDAKQRTELDPEKLSLRT